jgi:predicted nuclease of predicted toxin-antitoxin system
MLKFIIDTQLPPLLARYFTSKGCHAIHTTYFPNGHLLSDKRIVEIAREDNRIIVTKDSDFYDNYLINGAPPSVLILQLGNCSNKDLVTLLDHNLDAILHLFEDNADIIIIDKQKIITY